MQTPPSYGGNRTLCCYSSYEQCQTVNRNNFSGRGTCSCQNSAPASNDQPTGSNDDADRRAEEERRAREERERAEREAEAARKAEEEKQKFEQDKRDLLNGLKGATLDTPALKGISTDGVKVQPRGLDTPMGIKGAGPVELPLKTSPADSTSSPTVAWKQLLCSASIARTAATDALRESMSNNPNYDEADYLARQSQLALTGGGMGVACPDAMPPGVPPPGPLVELYRVVTTSIRKDVTKLKEIHERHPNLAAEKQKARTEIQTKTLGVAASKPKAAEPKAAELKKTEAPKPEIKKPSDAEEALRRAREMLAEDEQAEKEQADATKDLVNQRDILNKVGDHPELAPQLLNQIQGSQKTPAAPPSGRRQGFTRRRP